MKLRQGIDMEMWRVFFFTTVCSHEGIGGRPNNPDGKLAFFPPQLQLMFSFWIASHPHHSDFHFIPRFFSLSIFSKTHMTREKWHVVAVDTGLCE